MISHAGLLIIAGCSRRKHAAAGPVRALDLYAGGIIPQLRDRVGHLPELRQRVRILSAKYGLIAADHRVEPYDLILDSGRADRLRPAVAATLGEEFDRDGVPDEVLVVAEPPYVSLVAGRLGRPRVHTVSDPRDWPAAGAVLDRWGWP
jgi:hypothetical protein